MKRGEPLKRVTPLRRTGIRQKSVRKPSTAGAVLKIGRVPVRQPQRTGDFSPGAKKEVRRRSMGWCEMPGCTRAYDHLHHRLMRSHGGPGIAANALALCGPCHHYVHHGGMTTVVDVAGVPTPRSYAEGWIIRSGVEADAMKALAEREAS